MAQKLYKWTGDIIEPTAWESSIKAPQWYGSDDDGVSYAFLDEDFAKLCKSSKDDLAATTASSAKTWVKTKSQEAKIINNQCKLQQVRKNQRHRVLMKSLISLTQILTKSMIS